MAQTNTVILNDFNEITHSSIPNSKMNAIIRQKGHSFREQILRLHMKLLFQGRISSITNDQTPKHHSDTHTWKAIKKPDSG
jgi:hypothetical protein